MIISDRHKFVFVHVPKCAGSSVRKQLTDFDDTSGYFSGVKVHSELGRIDFVHIPMFVLRDHFPDTFQKMLTYWSIALVRDPFERFGSSLTQHLSDYGDKLLMHMSKTEIEVEIRRVVDKLSSFPRQEFHFPPELIHFQHQADFLFDDRQQVVQAIYPITSVGVLLQDLARHLDAKFDLESSPPIEKQSSVHRNEFLRRLLVASRPANELLRRILPGSATEKLRSLLYVRRDDRLRHLFRTDYVRQFISDYYRRDLDMWNRVKSASAATFCRYPTNSVNR